jgi:hypothetical protein
MKTVSLLLASFVLLAAMEYAAQNRVEAGIRGNLTIINATNDTATIYVNGHLRAAVGARLVTQLQVGDRGDATTVVRAAFDNGVTRVYRISSNQPYYTINVGFPQ